MARQKQKRIERKISLVSVFMSPYEMGKRERDTERREKKIIITIRDIFLISIPVTKHEYHNMMFNAHAHIMWHGRENGN